MLVGEERAANHRLSELITEIAGAVGSLDKNLRGGLIEPLADTDTILPRAIIGETGVGSHIDSSTRHWQRACATAHTVADLAAAARSRTVERLDSCREIVGLSLKGENRVDIFSLELGGNVGALGSELHGDGALYECYIILVGRNEVARIGL